MSSSDPVIPWAEKPQPHERESFLRQVKAELGTEMLKHAQKHVRDWAIADRLASEAFALMDRHLAAGSRVSSMDATLRTWIDKAAADHHKRTAARPHAPDGPHLPLHAHSPHAGMPEADPALSLEKHIRELEARLVSLSNRGTAAGEWEGVFDEYVRLKIRPLLERGHWITRCPHAAQDVVQEAFLALHEKLRCGGFSGNLGAWLSGVVSNKARQRVRNEGRRRTIPLDGVKDTRALAVSGEEAVREEQAGAVLAGLDHLPPQQREALILRHFEGLDWAQIGERMGISAESARQSCYRALAQLRDGTGVAAGNSELGEP